MGIYAFPSERILKIEITLSVSSRLEVFGLSVTCLSTLVAYWACLTIIVTEVSLGNSLLFCQNYVLAILLN